MTIRHGWTDLVLVLGLASSSLALAQVRKASELPADFDHRLGAQVVVERKVGSGWSDLPAGAKIREGDQIRFRVWSNSNARVRFCIPSKAAATECWPHGAQGFAIEGGQAVSIPVQDFSSVRINKGSDNAEYDFFFEDLLVTTFSVKSNLVPTDGNGRVFWSDVGKSGERRLTARISLSRD